MAKQKKITRAELAAMPHSELAKVGTKKRILASLPEKQKTAGKKPPSEEKVTPRERMARAHRDPKRARQIRRGNLEDDKGADRGNDD